MDALQAKEDEQKALLAAAEAANNPAPVEVAPEVEAVVEETVAAVEETPAVEETTPEASAEGEAEAKA